MRLPSLTLLFLLPMLTWPGLAGAIGLPGITMPAQPDAVRSAPKPTKTTKPRLPVELERAPVVVTSTGAGQAGYVHYWLITAPNGDQEMQVGIELPDQRIVWSFPGVGVTVAPFIVDGEYEAKGRRFTVQHQYGLRPYRNDAAVTRLQANLQRRVQPWLAGAVPYCELNGVTREVCVSCFGFAAQILYPGKSRMYPDFPQDFPRLNGEGYHTTEDLLVYLAGLHALPTAVTRQTRVDFLGGPPALREELIRLSAQVPDGRLAVASAGPSTKRRAGMRAPAKVAVRPG